MLSFMPSLGGAVQSVIIESVAKPIDEILLQVKRFANKIANFKVKLNTEWAINATTAHIGETMMKRHPCLARMPRMTRSNLVLFTVTVFLLCPGLVPAGGKPRPPQVAEIEKQGDFLILGFDDMSTRVLEISAAEGRADGHRGPKSWMIQSVLILDDTLALFQILTGQWQLWDIHENRFVTELPAMPVVGGLKGFYRISRNRVALTYYRQNSPMTVVDLQSGERREISAPAKPWTLGQIKGPLFLSLAEGRLSLMDIDSGPQKTAALKCRSFALIPKSRAVTIHPSGPGQVTLVLIRLDDMSVIRRREALLDISDFDTNFRMGCDPSGEILYVADRDSVSFFELPSLIKLNQIPGINVDFAGKKGLIAYESHESRTAGGKPQRSYCIRSLDEEAPRFCLDSVSNVSGQPGVFHLEAGLVWANNGKRLRMWNLESGRLVHDYELPRCQRSLNAKSGSLALPSDSAGLWDQAVDNSGHTWAACAGEKSVNLYRLGEGAPQKNLEQTVPSSFAVFILKDRKLLAHVDMQGQVRVWPYGYREPSQ